MRGLFPFPSLCARLLGLSVHPFVQVYYGNPTPPGPQKQGSNWSYDQIYSQTKPIRRHPHRK
jgi:hypothetical protein